MVIFLMWPLCVLLDLNQTDYFDSKPFTYSGFNYVLFLIIYGNLHVLINFY